MTKSYFNSRADIWDAKIAEKDAAKLARMARELGLKPGSTVLDVGTGTGILVPFILEIIGNEGKLVCLDSAEKMLDKARAKNFMGNIEFICADIEETRLADNAFDTIVCYSSFPHFQDKLKALKEIGRLLKKGGKVIICHTSSRDFIRQIHQKIPEMHNDLIPGEAEMQQLLSAAGFCRIVIRDEKESYLARAEKG